MTCAYSIALAIKKNYNKRPAAVFMNASLAFIPPNNYGTLIKYCVLEYAFREHFKWLRLCQCVYMKLSDFVPPISLVYQIEIIENTNISLPSNIKFSTHFPLINYSNFRWQKYLKNSHRKFLMF